MRPKRASDSDSHTSLTLLFARSFGVVNLATYRGAKVAVKQLLKVTDENVTRFRHECFLMKNLAHPHVVKLVGVVWDSEM